jgi:hypothetical protein
MWSGYGGFILKFSYSGRRVRPRTASETGRDPFLRRWLARFQTGAASFSKRVLHCLEGRSGRDPKRGPKQWTTRLRDNEILWPLPVLKTGWPLSRRPFWEIYKTASQTGRSPFVGTVGETGRDPFWKTGRRPFWRPLFCAL